MGIAFCKFFVFQFTPDSALSNYLKKSFIKYINVKSSSSQTLRTLSKNVSFWEIIILNSTCSLHIKRSSNVDFLFFHLGISRRAPRENVWLNMTQSLPFTKHAPLEKKYHDTFIPPYLLQHKHVLLFPARVHYKSIGVFFSFTTFHWHVPNLPGRKQTKYDSLLSL